MDDDHLPGVLRYVVRNSLRADLFARAEEWSWSGLPGWLSGDALLWRGEVVVRDERWLERDRRQARASSSARASTRSGVENPSVYVP